MIRIVDKAGFNRDAFLSEVRRALQTEIEARSWPGS
jgi:hypothetical protein